MRLFRTLGVTIVATFMAGLAMAQVPNPTVSGPIPSTAAPGDPSRNYPFFATHVDLAAWGYVEEEFVFEGTANRYTTTPPLETATFVDGAHPYRTRMLVRRPVATPFNGTVVVEWLNVTNGLDMENTFYQMDEHLLRRGYAWVGVSVQRIGVNRLRTWSPARYGDLDVSRRNADGTETFTNDALQHDIFSQAVQAIRQPSGTAPLGPLRAQRVIATGHSQSAMRLVGYINQVHPLARVVDAFALHGSLGNAVREDLLVPVAKILSEYDVRALEFPVRRPDAALFRTWEVAGTSHNDRKAYISRVLLQLRDIGTNVEASLNCTFMPPGSAVPFHHVMAAAIDYLNEWVRDGRPMPSAPPLEFVPGANPRELVRDQFGMAKGGIRLAAVEVPTAVSSGTNFGPGACDRWGYSDPLPDQTLQQLYPSQADYMAKVIKAAFDNVKAGYILPMDAKATVREAAQSGVGSR
ncbi:MAG TPA: alpha/beta hydrolase domain-containing protein [Caldimonas sp.]|nr:alpha/beta hydrolase domain-containing protein [Caldimonas sp.]HEX2540336.1 alpha/beta hydrolase domain-containing protein [Caldimonas sp.]